MSRPIPLSGGRKILPSREDLERQPFSFFASGKKRSGVSAKYAISGLILDDEGDPISGVTVTLSGDADSSVVTGVDGAFLFEDLSKGDYTVTPTRTSFVFTPASRSVTELAADTVLDSFEGVGSIYLISGTITGDEVENVTVTLSGDDNDEVITGADGTYSFEGLADGDYTVTPSLDGYSFTPEATNVTINNADQTGKNFVSALLVYTISGTITGDEVEGVTILLLDSENNEQTVETDESGDYSFTGLVDGDYELTPSLVGYTFAPLSIEVTISGADDDDNDFVSEATSIALPQTIAFSSSTDDYWGNAAKFIRYNSTTAVGTDDNVDPPSVGMSNNVSASSITGLPERAARMKSNHSEVIIYGGGAIRGPSEGQTKVFDPALGTRLMWVVGNEDSTGSSHRGMTTVIGLTRLDSPLSSVTYGSPLVFLGGQLYTHDVNDARMYLYYRRPEDEAPVYLGTYGLAGFGLKDSQAWVTCSLEVPPNYSGNLIFSFKVHGKNAPNSGSYTQPCPDLGDLRFDAPWVYKRCGGTNRAGYAFSHACWIGSASDDWPSWV